MKNNTAMFIKAGSVLMVTPVSKEYDLHDVWKITFLVYTTNLEISFSIKYFNPSMEVMEALINFLNNIKGTIIMNSKLCSNILLRDEDVYYKLEGQETIHSIEIRTNPLMPINPSIPVLNGLK